MSSLRAPVGHRGPCGWLKEDTGKQKQPLGLGLPSRGTLGKTWEEVRAALLALPSTQRKPVSPVHQEHRGPGYCPHVFTSFCMSFVICMGSHFMSDSQNRNSTYFSLFGYRRSTPLVKSP